MKKSLCLIGFTVGLAGLAVTGALAQVPGIQLVSTFDYPGRDNQTRPQKISDKNDITGIYVDSTGVSRGFIFYAGATPPHFSNPLVDPSDNSGLTEARGISNQRVVCGDYFDATTGTYHGFFYIHGHFQNFDLSQSTSTLILGINNARDFAGSVLPNGGIQEGFLTIGGTATKFAVTGATNTLDYQLNSTDQSCGYYIDSSGVDHGFWRDTNGTVNAPIDPVGSVQTILFGNNDGNQMVGRYVDGSGATHGILFIPSAGAFVVYDYPGATFTSLNGINKYGMIVGRYTDASGIDHGIILQVTRTSGPTVTLPLAPASEPADEAPQSAAFVPAAY